MLQELKNNLKNSVINISITVDSLGLFSGTFFQAGKKAASVVGLTEEEFKEELVYYINSTEEPAAQKSEKVKISTEKAKAKEASKESSKKVEKKAEEPTIDFDKDSEEETGNIEATQETKKESEKLKEEPKVEKPKAPEKSAANDDDDFDF